MADPVAWMTLNEDGDPAMLFFDRSEACTYCSEGEKPIPLSAPAPVDVEDLICTTVPGGSICDPQAVADAIRAYFAAGALGTPKEEGNG